MRYLLSIRARIAAILVLGLLLNVAAGVVAAAAARKADTGISVHAPVLHALQQIQITSTEGHLWFEELVGGDDTIDYRNIQSLWKQGTQYAAAIEKGGTAGGITFLPADDAVLRKQAADIQSAFVRFEALAAKRLKASNQAGSAADQEFDAEYETIMNLARAAEKEVSVLVAADQQFIQQMQWIMPLGMGLSTLLYLAGGIFLYRSISHPLRRIVSDFEDIRDRNDLTVRFRTRKADEIGDIMRTSDSLLDKLSFTLGSIRKAAVTLESTSSSLNERAEEFASVASSQASVAEEASATVEELSAAVERITDTVETQTRTVSGIADEVTRLASQVGYSAERIDDLQQVAADTARVQEEGRQELHEAAEAISRSRDSAGKIRQVVEVIREIADRVSLLSLNASIEAARAGEQGRGFAVVAEEVSKLAGRTSSSVKEIESLIQSVAGTIDHGAAATGRVVALLDGLMSGVSRLQGEIASVRTEMDARRSEAGTIARTVSGIREAADLIRTSASEQKLALSEISQAISGLVKDTTSLSEGVDALVLAAGSVRSSAMGLRSSAEGYQISETARPAA